MKISKDFGIVIRKKMLKKKSVNLSTILLEFNFEAYYDESPDFVSLGPFFGGDNADDCIRSLERQGLVYIDDFFIMEAFFPAWCRVEVFISDEGAKEV